MVDSDGVLNPIPPPANKPSIPPENITKLGEKSGKNCKYPIQIHNKFAPLDDADMEVEASRSASPRSRSGNPPLVKAQWQNRSYSGVFED